MWYWARTALSRRALKALRFLLGGAACLAAVSVSAQQVVCHVSYGGESQDLKVAPVGSPYEGKGLELGTFFEFRVVFQNRPADLASIKIYTYAQREEGTVLVHQAAFPYPPARHRMTHYGFTGVHFVYEAISNAELKYWCEVDEMASPAAVPSPRRLAP